ncbi:hypothetical protein PM082_001958 [Marasmius tenuissimus]|nr:hypothetical protein PM082_001958 [Marasmius tenuissimus]
MHLTVPTGHCRPTAGLPRDELFVHPAENLRGLEAGSGIARLVLGPTNDHVQYGVVNASDFYIRVAFPIHINILTDPYLGVPVVSQAIDIEITILGTVEKAENYIKSTLSFCPGGHDEYLRFIARLPEWIESGWFFAPINRCARLYVLLSLWQCDRGVRFYYFWSRAGSDQQLGTKIRISSAVNLLLLFTPWLTTYTQICKFGSRLPLSSNQWLDPLYSNRKWHIIKSNVARGALAPDVDMVVIAVSFEPFSGHFGYVPYRLWVFGLMGSSSGRGLNFVIQKD